MPHIAARTQKLDAIIARIAARQKGAVSRGQLLAAGLSRHQIQRRIDSGALIPIHPGVYLVGHTGGSPLAHESAAILACRPRALLSHRTAARLWQLPVPDGGPIEVTVVGRDRRALNGVRIYSLAALPRTELRHRQGLPLASPSLTILDLASSLDDQGLATALNEARVLRIVTEPQLRATLAAHPRRRGAGALRRLLESESGPRITRSKAERRALNVMRSHGLDPETNVPIGPWKVDLFFRRERLVVGFDSYRFHSTPKRFVDDRRRIADLGARGFQVLPLTWDDLRGGSAEAMRRLKATLALRRTEISEG